jgi:tetratricopeptide (TPR) repeat protein
LAALFFLPWQAGCSSSSPVAASPQPGPNQAQQYHASGLRLSRQGQSVRAEQYFLASIDAGGDEDLVLGDLIETCIASGRLRSAIDYVERALRGDPKSFELLRLAVSLYVSLGQAEAADEHVQVLVAAKKLPDELLLFMGEFFEQSGQQDEQALGYYQEYLERVGHERAPAWVSYAVRRLKQREELKAEATLVLDVPSKESTDEL